MTLLGNDIVPIPSDFLSEFQVSSVPLAELARRSDFISVNCDLNPTSKHLVNQELLDQMKPNAVLINTARGPIVNEQHLVSALLEKKIAGAALDVFEDEPIPLNSPLLKMDNVMLAPHNSNSSPTAWENVHWNTIRNLLLGLNINPTDLDTFKASV
jgi:D-3-phosphoglycerate dehydrogenase